MMIRPWVVLLVLGLAACGAASVSTPSTSGSYYAYSAPPLLQSGTTYSLGQNASLAFPSNNAPAQTVPVITPLPAPTPKWPLPEQVAGYAITLNNAVDFTSFPPALCVNGSFGADRTYWITLTKAGGTKIAQLNATQSTSGVCSSVTAGAGHMDANTEYDIVMWMSAAQPPPAPATR